MSFALKSRIVYSFMVLLLLLSSCNEENSVRTKVKRWFSYREMKDKVNEAKAKSLVSDSTNFLDQSEFDPFHDSVSVLLADIEAQLLRDSLALAEVQGAPILSSNHDLGDSISVLSTTERDSFTSTLDKTQKQEVLALKYNLDQLRKVDSSRNQSLSVNCKQKQCRLWAYIIKSKQMLYLYLDGTLTDSFKVSTGDTKHETPNFDLRPSGPTFKKYTSRKFPGGNYQGLGNMPYVVFIKGGFGIHGTTTGNIPKLGRKASHGCVRLHPDNGKLFFELVNAIGLSETWITIQD